MAEQDRRVAEDALRTLAAAAVTARLYPSGSDIPAQSVAAAVAAAETAVNASGTLRFDLNPDDFMLDGVHIGTGHTNTATLAETLYAHQVGQLVLSAGLTSEELSHFLACIAADPGDLRARGGIRAELSSSGVQHIAVVELTLRTGSDAALDLLSAPLADIGHATVAAADAWQAAAATGAAEDGLAGPVDNIEPANREITLARVAEALMQLDEATRVKVLAQALTADHSGERMESVLDAVTHMNPATLARLLMLAANATARPIADIQRAIDLPPETARALAELLAPAPRDEVLVGPGGPQQAAELLIEALDITDDDDAALRAYPDQALPASLARRALGTALWLARRAPDDAGILAVGDALKRVVTLGALEAVPPTLGFLADASVDGLLQPTVNHVRDSLSDGDALLDACRNAELEDDADVVALGALLRFCGQPGAEALLAVYGESGPEARAAYRRLVPDLQDTILAVTSRRVASAESRMALGMVELVAAVQDQRAIAALAKALEHVDLGVRAACLRVLADRHTPDTIAVLTRTINHWDPGTRRLAARELGRVRAKAGVPALIRILQGYELYERNYELKKEAIKALAEIGSPAARPVLTRTARRVFVFGRKNRELQFLARQALELLENDHDA